MEIVEDTVLAEVEFLIFSFSIFDVWEIKLFRKEWHDLALWTCIN